LWVLLFAAYSNSFQAGLVFDGAAVITRDPRILAVTPRNVGLVLSREYWYDGNPSDTHSTGLYRPLTTFSYLLNHEVFGNGGRPRGYHWTNFVLHALNVSLVYALGVSLLGTPLLGLATAALWGVHPLLTESVTNIAGRADLLAAFGVLAGLLCYVQVVSATGRRKPVWLVGLLAAQTVAIFSKESGAVLPGLMLLYDWTWPSRATWRSRGPAYAALALPLGAWVCLRAAIHLPVSVGLIPFIDNPLVEAGFWPARLTALKIMARYLGLFLWPAQLASDYSYNAVPVFGWSLARWADAQALVAAAALCAAVAAVRWRRRYGAACFFAAFFFIAFLPASNLVVLIGSIMAERFLYLPSVGLAGCVVVALGAAARRLSPEGRFSAPVLWIAMACLCPALAARTYARNFAWYDELSLWSAAVEVCPASAKAHNNLAQALSALPGRLPEAAAEYEAALRIYPDYAPAHTNLGALFARVPDRLPDAIAQYRAALRIQPDLAAAHNNLGNALARMPDGLAESITQYQGALRISPNLAEAHFGLGNVLSGMPGRLPDAIAEYEAAVRAKPDYLAARNNLGNLLSQTPGRLSDAIVQYRAALSIDGNLVEAHVGLAAALARTPGRLPDAIAEYETALRINPDSAPAHNNLGSALAQMPGRLPDAIAQYREALRIQPDYASAHYNLGLALANSERRSTEASLH
jgi:tetratricopeptide (TPR) repeat protein